VTAHVDLAGTGDGPVSCQARGPGPTGARQGVPAKLQVGTGGGSVREGTVTLAFGVKLDATGTLHIGCWETASGSNPSATSSTLVATKAGNLIQAGS
jgi:hypothetical protein